MLFNNNPFFSLRDSCFIETNTQLFSSLSNNFTVEFWIKPEKMLEIEKQVRRGISNKLNQSFVFTPIYGALEGESLNQAGVGISVGTNGVIVYEHTLNHLPPTLVFETSINKWTHIAIVYSNRTPSLYINGQFVKRGVASTKNVVPSGVLGGKAPFGSFIGGLSEVRVWSTVKTKEELISTMEKELTGSEESLVAYWKLNEGKGKLAMDYTGNGHNGIIRGGKWEDAYKNEQTTFTRVLFTFFVPSGGVETLNRQRYYALNEDGILPHFLYTQAGTGLQNEVGASTFVTDNDDEIKNIISNEKYNAIVVGSDLSLLKKIKDFGYDGILIYEIQGLGYNKEYAYSFLSDHAEYINKYCDAILYPQTPHLSEAFETYFPQKIKYCFHNCFDTDRFKYQYHPKYNYPILGWVGRIEENKNWRDFLKIGNEFVKENNSVQLWMFEDNTLGEKSERILFQKMIDELGLRNNLTIYANQPHHMMAKFFSIIGDSGGFLCSTSKVEGFGYAVLESMICRCPVLSTDSDGVRSFITHNITGKYFEFGNISNAVREGKELMLDKGLREKIINNGVNHIEEYFSKKKYAENFKEMLYTLESNKKC